MDIKLQQVSYAYSKGTPFEKYALYDVDLNIPHQAHIKQLLDIRVQGNQQFLQHFNGLLKPSTGDGAYW